MFLPCKPAAIPPTRPLGQPGGRSDHDHPPVAALTEWGPPLRGGSLPPGGQSIKLMPSRPNSVSYCGKRIPTHARQINPVIYQLCCFVEDFLKLFVLISTPFLCHNRGKKNDMISSRRVSFKKSEVWMNGSTEIERGCN